jgi:thioredoxin-like negative regulator of GroEL
MSQAHPAVEELTDATFRSALEKAPLAFVDLHASWCGPCRLFSPLFDLVAERHPKARFFKIDGDLNPECRTGLVIDNLPFVAVYRDGQFVQGVSVATEEGFEELVVKMGG